MAGTTENMSLVDILGPWIEPDWSSGLIARCRQAWSKPLRDLSREELATLLRQRYAVEHLLPVAKKKLADVDDETEMFEGELQEAIEYASRASNLAASVDALTDVGLRWWRLGRRATEQRCWLKSHGN